MSARVIMVASGKGGTGKSTVSVLTGAALAARGRRVLLVELDSALRSVDYIAGVYGKTVYDVEDVLCGRCDAGKALVESPLYPGLFVISAPYSGGQVAAGALQSFLQQAGGVFDDIVLDTAAGMGAPFEAARAAASLALICITPDPVAQRDGRIVCDALLEGGCEQVRLVINKVPRTLAGQGIRDLDECIDTVGAQLLGVVPYSEAVLRAGATASALPKEEKAARVFAAMAGRLCGVHAPLIVR